MFRSLYFLGSFWRLLDLLWNLLDWLIDLLDGFSLLRSLRRLWLSAVTIVCLNPDALNKKKLTFVSAKDLRKSSSGRF